MGPAEHEPPKEDDYREFWRPVEGYEDGPPPPKGENFCQEGK